MRLKNNFKKAPAACDTGVEMPQKVQRRWLVQTHKIWTTIISTERDSRESSGNICTKSVMGASLEIQIPARTGRKR